MNNIKVKVKPWEEIAKTVRRDNFHIDGRQYFAFGKMETYCEVEINVRPEEIRYYGDRYFDGEFEPSDRSYTCGRWEWHPDWLELGTEEEETERLMEYYSNEV